MSFFKFSPLSCAPASISHPPPACGTPGTDLTSRKSPAQTQAVTERTFGLFVSDIHCRWILKSPYIVDAPDYKYIKKCPERGCWLKMYGRFTTCFLFQSLKEPYMVQYPLIPERLHCFSSQFQLLCLNLSSFSFCGARLQTVCCSMLLLLLFIVNWNTTCAFISVMKTHY